MQRFNTWLVEKETAKSCREKFQKHVFGEFRGVEDDTPIEAEMYAKVITWLKTMNPSGDTDAKKAMSVFQTLKDCQKYYSKELKPTAKKAYRGKIITAKDITKGKVSITSGKSSNMIGQIRADGYLMMMYQQMMLKTGRMEMDDLRGAEKWVEIEQMRQKELGQASGAFANVPYTFKPSKLISSWSSEFAHAMQFAFSDDMSYSKDRGKLTHAAVVVEIDVDDNFVMNSKFMNLLGRQAGHSYGEDEMIRVSKKPAKGKVHFLWGERIIQDLLKKHK